MSITKVTDDIIETIDSSRLTGSLPAISAANLTGIPAGGPPAGITSTAGGTAMTINADNHVSMPNQPYFLANMSSLMNFSGMAVNTKHRIQADVIYEQQGSHYNTSTATFTAPITGKYMFNVWWQWDIGQSLQTAHYLTTSSSTWPYALWENNTYGDIHRGCDTWTAVIGMDAGDTAHVDVLCTNWAGYAYLYNMTWSGLLVS